MKRLLLFPSRVMSHANFTWREALESLQVMKSLFRSVILSLSDGLTKEWCIATHLFWKSAYRIGKKSGWLFLALYLKQCRVVLQRFVAGDKTPITLSPSISLTRGGLPRIIPSFHRQKIRRMDYDIIRLYLSLFSVSRMVSLAPKVSKDTFNSITTPAPLDDIKSVVSEMKPHFRHLLARYVPGIASIPLFQGLEFVPTWKSVPSCSWYKQLLRKSGDEEGRSLKPLAKSSLFPCFFSELAAFAFLMNFVHMKGEGYSQGCLWKPLIRYPYDRNNEMFTQISLEWFEKRIGPLIPSHMDLGIPPNTGRLCASLSGDGKRRLFAVGNYINQRLLYPMHQWAMKVLSRLDTDGTFNQTRPLDRLKGDPRPIHSVDLKSATDRWPLLFMFEFVQSLFGRSFASSAVNSALGTNVFDVAFLRRKMTVCFVAGQPLGYYSSWTLFALTHHMCVWYAAEQAYPGQRFDQYAILGDDVVIADDKVNLAYRDVISRLGVQISVAKSISSQTGAVEFAKRFRVEGASRDVSPLSIRKVASSKSPLGWYNYICTLPYPLRLSTQLRLGGLGFKAASRPLSSSKHGNRAKRMIVMRIFFLMRSNTSLELALTIVYGKIIPPELIGRVIDILYERLAPKDIILPPVQAFAYPGMMDFNEYSLYRGWMKQYLSYLYWHAALKLKPVIKLEDLFDAPVFIRTWAAPSVDLSTYKFGLMFQMIDWVSKMMDSGEYPKLIGSSIGESVPPPLAEADPLLDNHQAIRL